MNAPEKFPVLLDAARRAVRPMASCDHSDDGAQDPPSRAPSPPPPSPPSPDRRPEPMRDPPHPEHPDPVREPLWPEPVRDPPHPDDPDPERGPPWPDPVRDPPHPEDPDPVREPPSDRSPAAVTFARIQVRPRCCSWRVRAGERLVDQRHASKPARRSAIASRCRWPHVGSSFATKHLAATHVSTCGPLELEPPAAVVAPPS